jgi:lactate 2-monooxygenase
MTTANILGPSKWATYMTDIYRSRKSPQPLGTVLFEEIEARAQDTLNRYHGKAQYDG